MNQSKQPYTPPHLEQHPYSLVTGVSLPIGTSGLEPISDFLDAPSEVGQ